jgi:hypothetical protein
MRHLLQRLVEYLLPMCSDKNVTYVSDSPLSRKLPAMSANS